MEQDYSEILIFQQKGKNMTTKTTRRYPQSHLSRVSMDQAVRQPGTSMSAHHCHNYYEMYYVEQGSCRFMINDSFQDLCQGDCMLIPPQVFHYSRYINESCLRSNVYFRSEDIGELAMSFLPGGGAFFSQVQMFHVPEASQPQIHALLESMAREEQLLDRQTPALQYLHLQELFLLISRLCSFSRELPVTIQTSDRQTLLAARFISHNYMNPITSADIAAAAGFSPNHLSKRFRETAGIGVHEYLVFVRLQHAALELITTGDTITQIALRCGFSDSNYFKDVFKKKYGMTPRDYRKARKQQ